LGLFDCMVKHQYQAKETLVCWSEVKARLFIGPLECPFSHIGPVFYSLELLNEAGRREFCLNKSGKTTQAGEWKGWRREA